MEGRGQRSGGSHWFLPCCRTIILTPRYCFSLQVGASGPFHPSRQRPSFRGASVAIRAQRVTMATASRTSKPPPPPSPTSMQIGWQRRRQGGMMQQPRRWETPSTRGRWNQSKWNHPPSTRSWLGFQRRAINIKTIKIEARRRRRRRAKINK